MVRGHYEIPEIILSVTPEKALIWLLTNNISCLKDIFIGRYETKSRDNLEVSKTLLSDVNEIKC